MSILQCHIVSSKWVLKPIYYVKHNSLMSCMHSCIPGHVHVLPTEREREPRCTEKHQRTSNRPWAENTYYISTPHTEIYSIPLLQRHRVKRGTMCVWMVFVQVEFYRCTFSPLFPRRNLWSCQYKPGAFDLVQCEPCLCRGQATESIGWMLHHQLELQIMSSMP